MTKIAVLVGSLREGSYNKLLAKNLEQLAPEGVEFDHVDINLPLFDADLEADLPQAVAVMKRQIETADGVLFVTPEYNRGVSGVLKNAIDWASRPDGRNSFKGKPAGIVGASSGRIGTAVAQAALRQTLLYLEMRPLGQPEVYFGPSGELFDEAGVVVAGSREFLQTYIVTLTAWIRKA